MLKEICPQGVRDVSAEAYGERRGGAGVQSSLSADFKFPSSDLTDNLNNFKQASLGNHWFTEQTGSTSSLKQAEVLLLQFNFSAVQVGFFDWKWA